MRLPVSVETEGFSQILPKSSQQIREQFVGSQGLTRGNKISTSIKATIAVVEDNVFMREALVLNLKDAEVLSFASPEAFLTYQEENGVNKFAGILLDQHFDGSQIDGYTIAKKIRDLKDFSGFLVSISDSQNTESRFNDFFDLKVFKSDINSWAQLEMALTGMSNNC